MLLKLGGTKETINKTPRLSVFDVRARKAELRQQEVEGMQGGGVVEWWGIEENSTRGFLSRSSF